MHKRYELLLKERRLKVNEIQRLETDRGKTGTSGFLNVLNGKTQTSLFNLRNTNARIDDMLAEIRRIDFELDRLEAEARDLEKSTVFCLYCGGENEDNAFFAKIVGKELGERRRK